MVHMAPNTSSAIVSKSVARAGGRTSYRGLVQVQDGAEHSKSTVKCDALLVDAISRSDTYPYVDVREDDVEMGHEATVSKISGDQLFYLMSRRPPAPRPGCTPRSRSNPATSPCRQEGKSSGVSAPASRAIHGFGRRGNNGRTGRPRRALLETGATPPPGCRNRPSRVPIG
jgi:hypothetical protein